MKTGFAGLGLMGASMAGHLVRAGLEVAVYNRTREKALPLEKAGAVVCDSPAALGRLCDVVMLCVSDTPDVRQVVLGEDGVASGMAPGGLIVDHSTISPTASREIAAELAARGIGFVDAPVSGGTSGAAEGTLVTMMGGRDSDIARAREVVRHYTSRAVHVGPVGHGQLMKCCNQVVTGLHVIALAEGFRFARGLGLDEKTAWETLDSGAATSFIWRKWGGLLKEGDLRPGFKIGLHLKDLRLALLECERAGVELPGLKLTEHQFEKAVEMGLGELGDQALVKILEPGGRA
ncbi:NAD(P)-dependent oxidoreductase [bacterium]|nr:NAD(P)-dependent oxidoreductase [bacterium]